eukprot:CAMPEP_0115863196 /NCGR_PEP_ID=MMETSP0287-20121206/18568_1 /TAXON_ID=412157 /ORGANISM="Chrysochromulina rotalis, Strain UIO044" /LENGTH=143 /DNA_ID=CAMNT_0003317643 /DNA_START=135 /DNA_END=566 /DNA_ORIENTATION=-
MTTVQATHATQVAMRNGRAGGAWNTKKPGGDQLDNILSFWRMRENSHQCSCMLAPRPVTNRLLRQVHMRKIAEHAWRMPPGIVVRVVFGVRRSNIELEPMPVKPKDLGVAAACAASPQSSTVNDEACTSCLWVVEPAAAKSQG